MARSNDLKLGTGLWLRAATWVGIAFLFLPFPVLIAYSFNAGRHVTHWEGFSLQWYAAAFADRAIWLGVRNSLIVATCSTLLAAILGTMAALAIGKYAFRGRQLVQNLIYIPITLPEIIFGIALLTLFMLLRMPLGMITVICSHTTFSLSYVALIVLARLSQFDPRIEEASLDLGANRWQTFWKVLLPLIAPGVVSGALFAFTLSLDDFVITLFTSGAGSATLPLKIYTLIKFGVTPKINAVSTILILITILVLLGAYKLQQSHISRRALRNAAAIAAAAIIALTGYSMLRIDDEKTLNLFNYAEYIDEQILKDFERETGIQINKNYYNDNEEMLARLSMGAADYDLMVPSDFIIGVLEKLDLVAPINFNNIPNIKHIDPRFMKLDFGTEGPCYVPYTFGFSCIVYNTNAVKDPVDSWAIMWDERYKKRILMLDDMRESFYVAMKRLGYDIRDKNPAQLQEAIDLLIKQKPLLLKYESNVIEDYMIRGEVDLAHAWSGMALRLARDFGHYKFAIPEEGVAMFVDLLCIPKGARHKENAEKFINYLLRPDITARNMMTLMYPMPNPDARTYLPNEVSKQLDPLFDADLDDLELIGDLGEFNQQLDRAWTMVRNQ